MRQWMRLAAIPVLLAGSAWSQTMVGAAYQGPFSPAKLYLINPASGAASLIGPIGAATVSSLAFAPDGVTLYGVGIVGNQGDFFLLKINTSSGAGTPIGSTGLFAPCQDMAFRSDGKLFCYSLGVIFTINTTTGLATIVGPTNLGFPDGNGLAFLGNVLYTANNIDLETINQSTGNATSVAPLTYSSAFGPGESRPAAMKFHPNGTLYAAVISGRGSFPGSSLGVININSGVVTRLGPTVTGMDAIAISGATLAVPAPTSWILVVTGLALVALIQGLLWRRNKAGMVS